MKPYLGQNPGCSLLTKLVNKVYSTPDVQVDAHFVKFILQSKLLCILHRLLNFM